MRVPGAVVLVVGSLGVGVRPCLALPSALPNVAVLATCAATLSASASAAAAEPAANSFPKRSNDDAALLEWGHSAVIHAADAVIAQFGTQAEEEEFVLGIEASPVIAKPPQGCEPLKNAMKLESQMAFMMRGGCDFKTKARYAVDAGAVALVIINHDQTRPDHAFAMERPSASEADPDWEPEIPCVMVSWNSGQAIVEDNPERLRLYPGGGRPFIEGVSDDAPVVYLIHNMLTDEECDYLKTLAGPSLRPPSDADPVRGGAQHVTSTTLYQGVWKSAMSKAIDERVFSIIGFPANYFADLQVTKFEAGGQLKPHYDWLPSVYEERVMAVVYCLDDVEPEHGGAVVFPRAPISVQPQKGMAVVYHTSLEDGALDRESLHADDELLRGTKFSAHQYIYATPVPFARRVVLPALLFLLGGEPPSWVVQYAAWCGTFGPDTGYLLVNYSLLGAAVLLVLPFLLGGAFVWLRGVPSKLPDAKKKVK